MNTNKSIETGSFRGFILIPVRIQIMFECALSGPF